MIKEKFLIKISRKSMYYKYNGYNMIKGAGSEEEVAPKIEFIVQYSKIYITNYTSF